MEKKIKFIDFDLSGFCVLFMVKSTTSTVSARLPVSPRDQLTRSGR